MTARINSTATTSVPEKRKSPLFALGAIVATPAVLEHFDKHAINAQEYLDRHIRGDWGDVPAEDADENQRSIERGFRVLSAYEIAGERVWIITEADRSVSTLLFPREY
jgi:hypothetical protein